MRILVVEDGLKLAGLLRRGLEEEGYAVDVVQTGADAALGGHREPLRRHRPRRDAPRHRWLRGLSSAARGRPVGADHHAHGQGCRGRPCRGPRRGCRRLPDEAVRVQRAPRAAASPDPARPRRTTGRAARRRSRPRSGRPPRHPRIHGRRPDREGVRAARIPDAATRPGPHPDADPGARVGLRVRGGLQRGRRLHPLPAREGRPAVRARDDRDGPGSGYRLREDARR